MMDIIILLLKYPMFSVFFREKFLYDKCLFLIDHQISNFTYVTSQNLCAYLKSVENTWFALLFFNVYDKHINTTGNQSICLAP